MLQADSSNLEDFTTYTWASVRLVRDGVYEVVFGETLMLSAGWVKFVYFSGGGKDILGCSQPISVRWNINISLSLTLHQTSSQEQTVLPSSYRAGHRGCGGRAVVEWKR